MNDYADFYYCTVVQYIKGTIQQAMHVQDNGTFLYTWEAMYRRNGCVLRVHGPIRLSQKSCFHCLK